MLMKGIEGGLIEMKMYYVKDKETGNGVNYAEKRKKWFSKGYTHHVVSSPFMTLRPKEHIPLFKRWINNTYNPENYEIVEVII